MTGEKGSEFRGRGSGFRVQDSGFRGQGGGGRDFGRMFTPEHKGLLLAARRLARP
jgi:hypothetical protein